MGPSLISDGNPIRGHEHRGYKGRFNGAVADQRRKYDLQACLLVVVHPLQWGRR